MRFSIPFICRAAFLASGCTATKNTGIAVGAGAKETAQQVGDTATDASITVAIKMRMVVSDGIVDCCTAHMAGLAPVPVVTAGHHFGVLRYENHAKETDQKENRHFDRSRKNDSLSMR